MFLRDTKTTINGKTYKHYKIVESYRKNGVPKQRTIMSLGDISDEIANKIKNVLALNKDPNMIVTHLDDIVVTNHLAYLDIVFLHAVWQKWEFDKLFESCVWIEPLVLNRIIDPMAKINVKKWTLKTVLSAIDDKGIDKYNEFDVYRSLDKIYGYEKELQSFLYKKLLSKNLITEGILYYDITSTYFEGCKCILSDYGHSRDDKSCCEQIVIALMVTKEGYPFYWKVLEGNTQDVTTVKDLVDEIRDTFQIKHLTLVFDRGMTSKNNLKYITDNNLEYITALDKDEIRISEEFKAAMPDPISKEDYDMILAMNEFIPIDDNSVFFYREFVRNDTRYIYTFDVARFMNERDSYDERKTEVLEWIKDKNEALKNGKRKKKLEVLEKEINKVLLRRKLKKILHISIVPITIKRTDKKGKEKDFSSYDIRCTVDIEAEQEEMRMDGLWCFTSNVMAEQKTAAEVIKIYREKNKVEEAFHEIKSHVDVRPVRLTREIRVKAHVSTCMIAYFLYNDTEKLLKDNNIDLSPEKLFNIFSDCKADEIKVDKSGKKKYDITTPNPTIKKLLNDIGMNRLTEEKYYRTIMKKLV